MKRVLLILLLTVACYSPLSAIPAYPRQVMMLINGREIPVRLFGDELNAVFDQCSFAVGSLARHRTGISDIKTLKNREYASRGLPFVYSENDSDFDHQPYILKAPVDESPIDIARIVEFVEQLQMTPSEIRQTVEHLSWKVQMQKVVESVI